MPLTARERLKWNQIKEWEEQLYSYEANDFELTLDKWLEQSFSLLPEHIQKSFFQKLDTWLFHMHAMIQGAQFQSDARERIITSARVFDENIHTVEDLKYLSIDKLTYLAEQQMARHRLYSFVQGSLVGTGGTILLGSDIPAMAVINLRVVQLVAMSYGYEVNTPKEMMIALKVFHISTLPKRMQGHGWESLLQEMKNLDDFYFFEGNEELTDITWLEQPLTHVFKGLAIVLLRRKFIQGIPLVSMAIGAGANYQLTRKVTEFANHFYQMRYLADKERNGR